MHLIYLDESGNTGNDLADEQQPVFGLCAMVVVEDRWQSLEHNLERVREERMPGWRQIDGFEVHGTDLRKRSERARGMLPKSVDDSGIQIAEKLLHYDNKQDHEVIEWLRKLRSQSA